MTSDENCRECEECGEELEDDDDECCKQCSAVLFGDDDFDFDSDELSCLETGD